MYTCQRENLPTDEILCYLFVLAHVSGMDLPLINILRQPQHYPSELVCCGIWNCVNCYLCVQKYGNSGLTGICVLGGVGITLRPSQASGTQNIYPTICNNNWSAVLCCTRTCHILYILKHLLSQFSEYCWFKSVTNCKG